MFPGLSSRTVASMSGLRARVEKGRLVLDEPTALPEGTADDQIRAIDEWWRANRSAAPNRFLEELAASFELIGETPLVAM